MPPKIAKDNFTSEDFAVFRKDLDVCNQSYAKLNMKCDSQGKRILQLESLIESYNTGVVQHQQVSTDNEIVPSKKRARNVKQDESLLEWPIQSVQMFEQVIKEHGLSILSKKDFDLISSGETFYVPNKKHTVYVAFKWTGLGWYMGIAGGLARKGAILVDGIIQQHLAWVNYQNDKDTYPHDFTCDRYLF